ncbi:MAG: hypothetical protein A3F72_09440 [Bacteroidetes bacterium RIFCSPLOWO2_12_FULL_35_15]|nr:MAG: hypothetical protein A3F72_09440 [Bacteroidetes bacterium RIFCSPLOWO2_12_FULL_35_15]
MKKILMFAIFFIGISTFSFSQATGKGSEKSGGFLSRIFHKENKPRRQMSHFDKKKKDPNIKNNGTSYKKNRKDKYVVDGDGFGTATQGKKRKGKKAGTH